MGLQVNNLTGSTPPEPGNLVNLTGVMLDDNQLTGPIPAELGNLASLEFLYAQDNAQSGEIPSEPGNLSQLIAGRVTGSSRTPPGPTERR